MPPLDVHLKMGRRAVKEFVLHIKEDMEHRMKKNFQDFGLFK